MHLNKAFVKGKSKVFFICRGWMKGTKNCCFRIIEKKLFSP